MYTYNSSQLCLLLETTPLLSSTSAMSSTAASSTRSNAGGPPTTRAHEVAMTSNTTNKHGGKTDAAAGKVQPPAPLYNAYEPAPMQPICEEYFCRSSLCEMLKLVIVSLFVSLMVLVCFAGVALHFSVLQAPVPVNFILLIGALILLAYLEALHYSVVAVEKWDMTPYLERYPRAVRCHKLVNTPEKVKQFLVGRQFFTLFVVFLIAQITSFEHMPKDFLNLPNTLSLIFIRTGLPGVFLTLTFGQLVS